MLGRALVLLALVLACAACGGGIHAPRHGILFTYVAKPLPWGGLGGDIYVWTPGSVPRRLTHSIDPKNDPQWSPDGRMIAWSMVPPAFCGPDGGDECGDKFGCVDEIYVARADGGRSREVSPAYYVDGNQGCSFGPSWSPDGTRLVFERASVDGGDNLAVLSLQTGKVEPLHTEGEDAVWGKPGSAYLHTHAGRTNTEIRLMNTSTRRWKVFADVRPAAGSLAWSGRGDLATEQGRRIVVYSGSGQRIASFAPPLHAQAPAVVVWAPSGRQLLVCIDPIGGLSGRARTQRLQARRKRDHLYHPPATTPFVVDADGTHWRRLSLAGAKPLEAGCSSAASWR